MNITRKLLRIWLTVSSLIGFVLGWILTHLIGLPVRHHKKLFGPRQKPEVIEA